MSKFKKALSLYMYFFRIGWFTFGGGWSIVAQIQKDYVEAQECLTPEELLDIISVGRSLPGTMIGNVAYLFGYHQAGIIGGVLSVAGIVTPPLIILSILTLCYSKVKDNRIVANALTGVRASVAPIIFSAVMKLHKTAFPEKYCYAVCVIAVILSFYFKISCIYIILLGILAGLLLSKKKKEVQ